MLCMALFWSLVSDLLSPCFFFPPPLDLPWPFAIRGCLVCLPLTRQNTFYMLPGVGIWHTQIDLCLETWARVEGEGGGL